MARLSLSYSGSVWWLLLPSCALAAHQLRRINETLAFGHWNSLVSAIETHKSILFHQFRVYLWALGCTLLRCELHCFRPCPQHRAISPSSDRIKRGERTIATDISLSVVTFAGFRCACVCVRVLGILGRLMYTKFNNPTNAPSHCPRQTNFGGQMAPITILKHTTKCHFAHEF